MMNLLSVPTEKLKKIELEILKCFVALVKINRFDWMKNLTKGEKIIGILEKYRLI